MIDDTLLWVRSWQLCLQVLLGEGYYAERTSKQTVEILDRRGKALESQVDSLKAMMKDLKAEVSFFDATAAEAVVSFWILSFCLLVTYYYNFDMSILCLNILRPSSTDASLWCLQQEGLVEIREDYVEESSSERVIERGRFLPLIV